MDFNKINNKFLVALLVSLILNACTSTNKHPSDYLLPDQYNFSSPIEIDSSQIQNDVSYLLHFLKKGYGGRNYVPYVQLENTEKMLNTISSKNKKIATKDFCEQVDDALLNINDAHLMARLNQKTCSIRREIKRKVIFIGKNTHNFESPPWIKKDFQLKKKRVSIIAISNLPLNESSSWNGFLDAVIDAKLNSKGIIIDLRGNGGGDDTMGLAMVDYLYGQDHITNIAYRIKSKTPETMAMLYNNYQMRILKMVHKNDSIPDFLLKRREEAKNNFFNSLHENAEEEKVPISSGPTFDFTKAYTKPIILLIDGGCASSCESIVEALEGHPTAESIGTNTGGFVHFGNMGIVILPASKIILQMATDFWSFKDGRFIENSGFSPKIQLQNGQDGMKEALKRMKQLI